MHCGCMLIMNVYDNRCILVLYLSEGVAARSLCRVNLPWLTILPHSDTIIEGKISQLKGTKRHPSGQTGQ